MGIYGNDPLNSALTGFTGLFGKDGQSFEGNILSIEINMIATFKNHPFKVLDDERMEELVESIQEYGILTPVLVRNGPYGTYEMLSGHRRLRAAEKAGLTKIPAKILDLNDVDATIFVVDSNIQREEILPSEKAFAFKMKMEALKKKRGRPFRQDSDGTDCNLAQTTARDILAEQMGVSAKQIQRFIRLTELISPLLDRVDRKEIGLLIGNELSFLPEKVQEYVDNYLEDGYQLRRDTVVNLRNYPELENLKEEEAFDILNGIQPIKDDHTEEPVEETLEAPQENSIEEEDVPVGETAFMPSSEQVEDPQNGSGMVPEYTREVPVSEMMPSTPVSPPHTYRSKRPRLVHFVEEKIDKYFPPTVSDEEIEKIIITLLEAWLKARG